MWYTHGYVPTCNLQPSRTHARHGDPRRPPCDARRPLRPRRRRQLVRRIARPLRRRPSPARRFRPRVRDERESPAHGHHGDGRRGQGRGPGPSVARDQSRRRPGRARGGLLRRDGPLLRPCRLRLRRRCHRLPFRKGGAHPPRALAPLRHALLLDGRRTEDGSLPDSREPVPQGGRGRARPRTPAEVQEDGRTPLPFLHLRVESRTPREPGLRRSNSRHPRRRPLERPQGPRQRHRRAYDRHLRFRPRRPRRHRRRGES